MEALPLCKSIEQLSYDILKASKSLDIFPTPVDRIVAYSELIVRNDIDVAKIHNGYITRNMDTLRRSLSKVRGLLDRRERHIYLDLRQLDSRKNFVKLHETGHHVLPWQRGIYEWMDDDDRSLSGDAVEEFEAEANYFASVTLFQHGRFDDEMAKLTTAIQPAIHLSRMFGASVHATLRRMVERSKKRCALVVLEDFAPSGQPRRCNLRNLFLSEKFRRTFGDIYLPQKLDDDWRFVNDYYFGRKLKLDGECTLPTKEGLIEFSYEFFHNTYNAFILILPKGEPNKSRTTFYVNDNQLQSRR